jgi:S1-C subfamily serine protease
MKLVKVLAVFGVPAGLALAAFLAAPSISGQTRAEPPRTRGDAGAFWAGARIGASVRDLAEADRSVNAGVYVEEVRPDGPAAKAGFRQGDILTRFAGETVRSVRQLMRLLQETPAGRTVAATVVRDGKTTELSLVPEARSAWYRDGGRLLSPADEERLRERLERAREEFERIPYYLDFDFPFDGAFRGLPGRSRLGVTLQELPPQLAAFFGASDGVLVSSVLEDSAASRAGLRAGDVITSVNGRMVSSVGGLVRELRDLGSDVDVTIGIVRDKMETTVKARLDDARTRRPARPVRAIRATPA